jgi:transposase
MKDNSTKQTFIELRAKGNSYDAIAKELKVTKQTLIEWSKGLSQEIDNIRQIEIEALRERLKLTELHKLEIISNQLKEIETELSERDLTGIKTEKLIELKLKLLENFQSGGIVFSGECEVDFSSISTSSFTSIKWKG